MGHRFNYFAALILFIAAITFILIALINDKRNWWTVSVDCSFFRTGYIDVQYGPLGYWLPGDDSGTAFSSKSSDACYPLHTGSGGNQDLRYIGIVAVIVMAIAVLFAFGALLQVIAALFELGHAHHHAKRSAHAAILAGILSLIGAILVLGWYVGVADSYSKPPSRSVQYAQILAFCSAPASTAAVLFIGAFFVHRSADKHHGYSPF